MPNLSQTITRNWWDLRLGGWTGIFAASGIVALLFAILYLWGLPLMAETAARFAPRAVEERLGIAVVNILTPAPTRISDPAREQLLGKVVARLAKAAGSKYARLGMVNAFAAPGEIIVVSDSLVHLTQTPKEFAGVLAHEMQHVIHKHSTKRLARQMGGQAILSLMAVDSAGTPLALEGVTKLVNLGYQRSDEEAADEEGVALLIKAGIGTDGLAAFLQRIQNSEESGARYLSTHPVTADRVARVKALAKGHSSGTPLLTAEEWTKARSIGTNPQ
jgi:beta-barrel assembly-enhancing protease